MRSSQKFGPFLGIDYMVAPNIQGVPKWDPSFGNLPKHWEAWILCPYVYSSFSFREVARGGQIC